MPESRHRRGRVDNRYIVTFMVISDEIDNIGIGEAAVFQDTDTNLNMTLHDRHFFISELPVSIQNLVAQAQLTDIEQHATNGQ